VWGNIWGADLKHEYLEVSEGLAEKEAPAVSQRGCVCWTGRTLESTFGLLLPGLFTMDWVEKKSLSTAPMFDVPALPLGGFTARQVAWGRLANLHIGRDGCDDKRALEGINRDLRMRETGRSAEGEPK